jgi:hypothetical protein
VLRGALPRPERGQRVHDLDDRGLEVGVDRRGRGRADQRGRLRGARALRDRGYAVEHVETPERRVVHTVRGVSRPFVPRQCAVPTSEVACAAPARCATGATP